MTRPSGSRIQKVMYALHLEGTVGATTAELAKATNLPYSDVARIIASERKRKAVTILAARRNPVTGKLHDVWGCCCRMNHQIIDPDATPVAEFVPLDETTIERGREGLAAARALLDAAPDRNIN